MAIVELEDSYLMIMRHAEKLADMVKTFEEKQAQVASSLENSKMLSYISGSLCKYFIVFI